MTKYFLKIRLTSVHQIIDTKRFQSFVTTSDEKNKIFELSSDLLRDEKQFVNQIQSIIKS